MLPVVFKPSLNDPSEEINPGYRSLPFVCLKIRFSWVRLGKGGRKERRKGGGITNRSCSHCSRGRRGLVVDGEGGDAVCERGEREGGRMDGAAAVPSPPPPTTERAESAGSMRRLFPGA